MKFQACIGPGTMRVVHLRDAETTRVMNGDLVLCEATSAFHDYHGRLDDSKLCRRCIYKLGHLLPFGMIIDKNNLAELIGVAEIIPSSKSV